MNQHESQPTKRKKDFFYYYTYVLTVNWIVVKNLFIIYLILGVLGETDTFSFLKRPIVDPVLLYMNVGAIILLVILVMFYFFFISPLEDFLKK